MRGLSDSWTPIDRALALALQLYEDGLCPGCGQQRHEAMDPDSEGRWAALDPARCHACTALAAKAKEYADTPVPSALRYTVGMRPKSRFSTLT